MAFPTVPALATRKKKHHFVLRRGSTVLGQVGSFTPDETINTNEEGRISDSTKYQEREDKTSNLNMVVYVQNTMEELALIFGVVLNKTTGWAGETIQLDPDSTAADYSIDVYDTTDPTTAVLQGTWTADNWQPTSFNMPVGENTGSIVATVNGVCEAFYYIGANEIGST